MNKSLLTLSTYLIFSFLPVSAQSDQQLITECNKTESTSIKYSQCLDIVKIKIDRELETWVNNQLFFLEDIAKTTGRKSAYNMFLRAQRNFITYRDNNCKWQFLAQLPSNVSAPTYKECYILTSKDRIRELSRISK